MSAIAVRPCMLATLVSSAFAFAACGGGSSSPGFGSTGGSTSGGSPSSDGASSLPEAGPSGVTQGEEGGGANSLPVEPTFNPGGYFSKDNADVTGTADCPDMPSAALSTPCRTWTYAPNVASDTANGEFFAGVFWLYGNQNWGASPGAPIPAGYSSVTFWAKGANGGEQVSLLGRRPEGEHLYADAASRRHHQVLQGAVAPTTLTDQWAQYSISLAGVDYSAGVLGGFAWSASYDPEGGAPSPITFYLGGMEWQ